MSLYEKLPRDFVKSSNPRNNLGMTSLPLPTTIATTISSGQERLGFKSSIILYTDWTRTVRTVHMRMVANNFTQRDHNHIISEIHEI